jgi:hypothetical protein
MQDFSALIDPKTQDIVPQQTVVDLINRKLGNVERGVAFEVVDTNFLPVPCMPGGGNDFAALVDLTQTCQVAHDSTQPIHRTLQFSMRDPKDVPGLVAQLTAQGLPLFPFNPYLHFLHVFDVMTATDLHPNVTIKVSLGYFVAIMPSFTATEGGRLYTWNCQDLTYLVNRTDFLSDWAVNPGYTGGYVQAMTDLLTAPAIPLSLGGLGKTPVYGGGSGGNDDAGPNLPLTSIAIPTTGNIAIPFGYLFQAGTNRLAAINQLASAINYYGLSMASDGTLGCVPMPFYGDAVPPVGWDYTTAPGVSIVGRPVNVAFSSQADARIANIVKVETQSTASGGTGFSSVVQNNSADSIVSTVNLKTAGGAPRALVLYESNSVTQDQQMTDLRAKLLLQQGAMLSEVLTISTMPNPLHGDREILLCQVAQSDGTIIVPSSADSPFEEQGWSLGLGPSGRMSHTLQRIVSL